MKSKDIKEFIQTVWNYYYTNKRTMPWRENTSGYYVFLSEIMLQQTQVERVKEKFDEFIDVFPDFESLASADFQNVLSLWSGLGYNRRARYLYDSARRICSEKNGVLPNDIEYLVSLSGIGISTASAILVYAFNVPYVFIETNVRTVFIYHFFKEKDSVSDKEIEDKLKITMDKTNPREWYWALMDYGTYLKKEYGNFNKKSKLYTKQSKFEGSLRQKRGLVLRLLLKDNLTFEQIVEELHCDNVLTEQILDKLVEEKLIVKTDGFYTIVED